MLHKGKGQDFKGHITQKLNSVGNFNLYQATRVYEVF